MQKIILSPPVSNLIKIPGTSRIVGSYTFESRPGLWRNLTKLRKAPGGWYNRVGLRNPGIKKFNKSGIVSLAGFCVSDFEAMLYYLAEFDCVETVEFNISCPNADVVFVTPELVELANRLFGVPPIIKVPHALPLIDLIELADLGNCVLHISNTKSTPKGALSGRQLIDNNLDSIYHLKRFRPRTKVIAGGGIYNLDTLKLYASVGADHFSLSTVLFNPYATYKIISWSLKHQEPTEDKQS